ncbi:hypothetical protein [Corynebacterium belfantii]|uniref:hypothetical protein n=1 Tax=Corynebacterium belfantii TaxID=2014537 RepID=UPI0018D2842F|nr:hypothetical protein [Corynebacterium belfantii]MBG9349221.1 hypothetical protein [Corynebacterium belfantii]QVI97475.1 hypothetical protein KFR76_07485 [Corynebacterium diphtheriae]QVI97788.1 hypothetical protein KFR76_09330 [Corynebacterium diphtheriae]
MGMNIFIDAVADELERQPWYLRYKGTILLALTSAAWVLATVTPMLAGAPSWVGAVVASVVSVITILANRLTRDGVTPSMAGRLEKAAARVETTGQAPTLPVWDGPTTGDV